MIKRILWLPLFVITILFPGKFKLVYSQIIINDSTEFSSSNLPIIFIDTDGQQIIDDERITANMGIIYNGAETRNNISDTFNEYNGNIAIELRGSMALLFPKKSYRFETHNDQGEDLNVSLLDMPSENDWILYAPFVDLSMIRNVLVYDISNDIGRYASRTRLCELVLNGNYQGVYVLMEKIKRDNNRVDIAAMNENDTAGDSLTGGYIIKIDKKQVSGIELDEIDEKIIEIHQEAERRDLRIPGSRIIAKKLYASGITRKKYSHQGIQKRIRKLRENGLIGHPDDNKDSAKRCTPDQIEDMDGEGKLKKKF